MLLANRYRLDDALARGGMGQVWRAYDTVLSRPVAVKEVRLPPGVSPRDREVVHERTFREARAAARLDHPGVVRVYDIVEADDRPWIVMQLVQATTLEDHVRSHGPLEPRQVARIGLAVADALAAAHAAGIVHRDVKPRNILLTDDGRAMLTDFGIATSSGDPAITDEGVLIGSPAYMAPEQARGARPGAAADLWSLGATLYLAVEGCPPFSGATPIATLISVMLHDPAPVRAAGALTGVLHALLAKDPAERPSDDEARRALRAVAEQPQGSGAVVPTRAAPSRAAPSRATPAGSPAGPRATAAVAVPEPAGQVAVVELAALAAAASKVGMGMARDVAERVAVSAGGALTRRGARDPRRPVVAAGRRQLRFKKRWVAVPLAAIALLVGLVTAAVTVTAWLLVHLLS
ncbi:MAG: protein kinase domain-containing protein [Frankiaceae bacterium]